MDFIDLFNKFYAAVNRLERTINDEPEPKENPTATQQEDDHASV